MNRVGSELPVEGLGQNPFRLEAALGDQGTEFVGRVLRRLDGIDGPLLVGEGRLDGMKTEELNPPGIGVLRRFSARAPAAACYGFGMPWLLLRHDGRTFRGENWRWFWCLP